MSSGRPTLDDVAALAGVSRMTVSNAFNRPDQLSAATRLRVLESAAQLGYAGPDPAARSLRRGRAGAVGLLLTERLSYAFTDPGMVELLRGVAGALSDAGQGLLLVPTLEDSGEGLVRDSLVDAFIVCSVPSGSPAIAAVRARRLPLVTVGSPRIPGVPFVGIDNEREGRAVAKHLLDLGHSRLAVVDVLDRDRPGLRARARGFSEQVRAVLGDGAVTVQGAEVNDRAGGRAAAASLLGKADAPTAIFAVTDVLALGVLEHARQAGVDVPGRLSVAGFDDVPDAARAEPPLTTVRQRLSEQGRAAASIVLGLVAGQRVRPPRLPTQLVVRGSTGPAPVSRR
jgi:DNA-binding LacI/PurR family transcriptional regulator